MDFIDEENPIRVFLHFVDDFFQPFLKLPAILRAGDDGRHIEGNDVRIFQHFRDVSVHDALREPFGNRRLPDARLPDEDRIVLAAPRKNLNHAADFVRAADDGIDFSLPRAFIEIYRKFGEFAHIFAALPLRFPFAGENARKGALQIGLRHAEMLQNAQRRTALADERQEQMLGADIAISEIICLLDRHLQDPFCPRRRIDAGRVEKRLLRRARQNLLNRFFRNAQRRQDLPAAGFLFVRNAEQQMLRPHGLMPEASRRRLRKFPSVLHALRISFFHNDSTPSYWRKYLILLTFSSHRA